MLKCAFVCITLACSAAGTGGSHAASAVPIEQETSTLSITVITASDNMTRLPGADISVVRSTGLVRVATTDQFGHIELRHDVLMNSDSSFIGVMICHPVFYCGLLRDDDISGRGEITIALATRVAR